MVDGHYHSSSVRFGAQGDAMNELGDGARVARNVTIVTFFLAVGKLVAAVLTGSVAIMADAYHSFSDLIPIIAAWLGLKIAQKPANEKFPYGYYRAENIAALFSSFFIFFLGYEILSESAVRLSTGVTEVSNDAVGLGMIFVAVVVSYLLYRYQFLAAKRTRSQALMANAMETKMDIASALLVLVGFVASMLHVRYVEGAVGIILSLFVFYAGFEILRDSVLALMDAGVSAEELSRIRDAASGVPQVKEVKEIRARHSGPFLMVELTISVPERMDVDTAHIVADKVERSVMELGIVDHVVVHVEPEKGEVILARPVNEDGSIAEVFGSAPYFDILTIAYGKEVSVGRMKNPGFGLDKKRGVKAALALIERGVDVVEVHNIGEDSRRILEDAGVKVRVLE